MTQHVRWVRRSLALWAGLSAAWGAGAVVEYLRYRERLAPLLLVTGVIALLFGGIWTARLRSEDEQPVITVEDLRRH